MAQIELEGEPPIAVELRRSTRARRLSLRISRLDGKVSLTIPKAASEREALSFLRSKRGWLDKHLDGRPDEVHVGHGACVPLGGELFEVAQGARRGVQIREGQLLVGGAPERAAVRLEAYLKAQARLVLAREVRHYANKLGRPHGRITLRDTRSRWGSCTATGNLNFSWRLIMAPPEVLAYVAAHEVAHLAEMNHSERFWRTCEDLFGDTKAARRWLRQEGPALHLYRFKG